MIQLKLTVLFAGIFILGTMAVLHGATYVDQWQYLSGKNPIDFIAIGYRLVTVISEPSHTGGNIKDYYLQRDNELVLCMEVSWGGNMDDLLTAFNNGQPLPSPQPPSSFNSCFQLTAPTKRALPAK